MISIDCAKKFLWIFRFLLLNKNVFLLEISQRDTMLFNTKCANDALRLPLSKSDQVVIALVAKNMNISINYSETLFRRQVYYQLCCDSFLLSKLKSFDASEVDLHLCFKSDLFLGMHNESHIRYCESIVGIERLAHLGVSLILFVASLFRVVFMLRLRKRQAFQKQIKYLFQVSHFGTINKEGISESYVLGERDAGLLKTKNWVAEFDVEKSFDNRCKKNEVEVLDIRRFKFILSDYGKVFREIFDGVTLYKNMDRARFLNSMFFKLVFYRIEELLICLNARFKYFVAHDDITIRPFARKGIFSKYGLTSIGIQHSSGSGLVGNASLGFVCFDLYLVQNKFIFRQFSNFWSKQNIEITGYSRISKYVMSLNNSPKIKNNFDHFTSKYGLEKGKNKILITLPRFGDFSTEQLREFYINFSEFESFLKSLPSNNYFNCVFIVRSKIPDSKVFQKQLPVNVNKFLAVSDDYDESTQDLIMWSDLVIASNASGIIDECCILGKKVVCFDFLDLYSEHWNFYGKSMNLKTELGCSHFLSTYFSGKSIDVDWEKLRDDIVAPDANKSLFEFIDVFSIS